jgi:putative salt-induced outer membrane protein
MKDYAWIAALALLAPLAAWAAETPPPPPNGVWTGKGQLGFVDSQGNTQAKSANAMLDMGFVDAPWKHALHLESLYGENSGVVAAERWQALWQSNYAFTPRLFGFGGVRYDHDLFSGFQYQGSITAGAGYSLIDTKTTQLSVQLGAGYRELRPEEIVKNSAGVVISRTLLARGSGAIATGGLDYSQALTGTTTLTDKLTVESGSLDTLLTNALALTVKMTDKLALSIGYSLQNNSKPPAGLKHLDTIETVNLVFGF